VIVQMDVLSDLLHRACAGNAFVRQLVHAPPWSMTYTDPPPLTVVAVLGGDAVLRLGNEPAALTTGDIALVKRPGPHTVADSPATAPMHVIRDGRKYDVHGNEVPVPAQRPRTYGDGGPGATTVIRGGYPLRGGTGDRLLTMLPPLAVVPAGARTRAALELLTTEAACDEPGQDAVLVRLLDLVLVMALRSWCARPDVTPPAWYRALSDEAVGEALCLLHTDPARRWTVAELASRAGLSRAAFAARFAGHVGEPPLTYLTGWRMSLAADRLDDSADTVAVVARDVGYADGFAFSVAFKRAYGMSPSAWRRRLR
jgi:AraC-like DNA-binding protein